MDSACRSSSTRRTPCMLMRSYVSVMVVSSAEMRQSRAVRNACSAIALSFPPLQQKRSSSGTRTLLMARGVFHTDAKFAAERGIAVHLLILLVGEIGDSGVEAEAARDVVTRREIDQRVARVDDLPGKVVVGALAREISGEIPVHPPVACIQREIAGIDRPAEQPAADQIVGIDIKRVCSRRERPRGIVGVTGARAEPASDARFPGKITSAGPGEIRIKKGASTKGSPDRETRGGGLNAQEADDVVEAAIEIIAGHPHPVRGQFLFKPCVNRPALIGQQIGVAGEAWIGAV